MIDRWIELTHLLEREGIDVEMEGTPSCPVLYHRPLDLDTVVGIDMESVWLYLDLGPTEMPQELVGIQHGGDPVVIVNTMRALAQLSVAPDLKWMITNSTTAARTR